MVKTAENTQKSDKIKYSVEQLTIAFTMLDMAIGRAATDLIIRDVQRRGIMLNDATKSYSLAEVKKALRVTFSEDATSALIYYLKQRL